jgi:hypothetical protein
VAGRCATIAQRRRTGAKESAMSLAEGIRKHGFRKWYERELLQSHVHLVLTFLCAIGLFAAFEAIGQSRSVSGKLMNIGAVLVLGAAGVWALRRYLYLLLNAEALAHKAQCPRCHAYARFVLIEPSNGDEVAVQCKRCDHRWHIGH